MTLANRRALTLVELLLAITILTVLILLLLPTLSAATQIAHMTQCRNNLYTIYQAQILCQEDRDSAMFVAKGNGWNTILLPYIERRLEVFRCPSALANIADAGSSDEIHNQTPGIPPGPTPPNPPGGAPPPDVPGFDISFAVYSGQSFTRFLWNVSFNSPWCRTQNPPADGTDINGHRWGPVDLAGLGDGSSSAASNCWRFEIEDLGYLVEQMNDPSIADDYADIDVVVYYENGYPAQVKIIQHKNGSQAYRYDMLINGQLVVHNIDANQGKIIDLRPNRDPNNPPGRGLPPNPDDPGRSSTVQNFYAYVPCDYGMSVGSYYVPGVEVSRIDEKLFLILDYPKRVADYTDDGADALDFDKYFFANSDLWLLNYKSICGTNWMQYQALRHFSKANVLFCDGHVELLPVGDGNKDDVNNGRCLDKRAPNWQYGRPPM
jgi:prepilin-type processing-associated H-X9-DG protein